ncbi:MAG TPA: pitrilysin family protein [Candidatus Binatia bacterium]|nr:pitrilysin family protein [Candidatus Binatia bacterium]
MSRPARPRAGALGALVLALVPVLVLARPAAVATAPLAHREVLPNGLVLLVAERPAVPIVAVRVSHRAGAAVEPPDKAGLAHLTGASLTRGTARRTAQELDAAIEFVGGRLEAGAGRDSLTVSLSVLHKDLGLGLDLLQEVVLTPAFPAAEVQRKAAEIQAAIQRSEENPETVAARALARLVYPGHPYGTPVEGTRESVGRLTRDDVAGFHARHVRPDTTVIAVVGAVTVEEARREIMRRFGAWPRPEAPPPPAPPMAAPGTPGSETIKREHLTQTTILLGRQAVNQRHPDYFPLAVASYVLGGGSASRLYQRVREEGGLAYAVYSYLSPGRYGAAFAVSAQTRTAEAQRVVEIFREELDRMAREPVTERELELARAYLIGSFPLRLDTSAKVADFLVAVEELGLGLDYADRYRERIARVTAADVQRVAAAYFRPGTFSRVLVGAVP